ncbi:hypothetical protein SaSA20_1654a [Streptococcus agalactiae]|nr:hypothetical protein SaSA20_1654a [Streptococcus agalactiae]
MLKARANLLGLNMTIHKLEEIPNTNFSY